MRTWDLTRQATIFRGIVFASTYEDNVMERAIATRGLCEAIKAIPGDAPRAAFVKTVMGGLVDTVSGMVSYVGKTASPNAEPYIRDFRSLAESASPLGVQIAAAGGYFHLDLIQPFGSDCFAEAMQKELRSQGIPAELVDKEELVISKAAFPWLPIPDKRN